MATSNAFLFAFIFFVKKKQAIFFSFRQVWCIHETKVAMYFFDFVLSNNFVNVKQTLWSKMSKMKYNVGRWFKHVRPNKECLHVYLDGYAVISITLRHWPTLLNKLNFRGKAICTCILDGVAPKILRGS